MLEKTAIPIIKNKFYFLADKEPPRDIPNAFFFNIDKDLVYEPFYEDFGPLNLAKIWKYISEVSKYLTAEEYSQNVFYHHTSLDYRKCSNSALLVCAYLIIVLKRSADQAYLPFEGVCFRPFRDASYGQCSYPCTILDCLKGLEYAIKLGWFDFKSFDLAHYQHYEKIENGDLNWVVPGKLIAFSSPSGQNREGVGYRMFTPKDYLPILKKFGATAVMRLNNEAYNANDFTENGINHYDLYFTDGTSPSEQIVNAFLDFCENEEGPLAIHCKAGLGRTGTLIGCYAIKKYRFPAADFIGWIRLCRPGSVLGPQQYFLIDYENSLKKMAKGASQQQVIKLGNGEQQMQNIVRQQKESVLLKHLMNEREREIQKKGEQGQGNYLLEAKKRQQHGPGVGTRSKARMQ